MGEGTLRLTVFVALFGALALAEATAPRRVRALPRRARWPANLGLSVLGALLVRLLLPTAAVGLAELARQRGWGLLHQLALPDWAAAAGAFLALDLLIYAQHRLFHAVPALWRLHRVHHSDLDFDVTTAVRFHPVEIFMSMLIKMGAVAALGAPPAAVVAFEITLNATAMFNHANLRLPAGVDRLLRLLLVTPDMHRVHHSVREDEMQRNFGFNVPWWDRLLGTYRAQPRDAHAQMRIGLETFREPASQRLGRLLLQPLAVAVAPGEATRGPQPPG
jgi:sterol desaturase/sphingolipid hydroxylase (fatty acid hydroxylase superfamily)